METQTIIQPTANIARIVEVRKGDVFKRLEESSYGDDKMVYGVITDVLHNGEQSAIQVMEFTPGSFGDYETKIKTYSGNRSLALFPATPAELKVAFEEAVERAERNVETKQSELNGAKDKLSIVRKLVFGELADSLSSPKASDEAAPVLNGLSVISEDEESPKEPF